MPTNEFSVVSEIILKRLKEYIRKWAEEIQAEINNPKYLDRINTIRLKTLVSPAELAEIKKLEKAKKEEEKKKANEEKANEKKANEEKAKKAESEANKNKDEKKNESVETEINNPNKNETYKPK